MKYDGKNAGGLAATPAADSRFGDPRVVAAVHEFFAALEAGDPPDREEFIARHPEIAAELRECLAALEVVHGAAPDLGCDSAQQTDGFAAAPKLLGDYRLLRELGRGGMGVVYEAVQISLNRRVAVKVLPLAASLDGAHLQRFRNEAQAAAQLHHANIVPVYAVGVERGVHFYAMQLIDGEPLDRFIAYLRQMSGKQATGDTKADRAVDGCRTETSHAEALDATTESKAATSSTTDEPHSPSVWNAARSKSPGGRFRLAADLARQAALGLEHAHQFGVVHRDVKPGNLLLDEAGHLWITDFGLAHIQADVTLTRTGDVLGTARYMSPEQAAGNWLVLDHRTDVYSLGATLYELLTLVPVFAESDRHMLLRRIMEDEPIAPRTIRSQIPVELETIVLKAMAKSPQDRYATAKLMADDLQRWLDDKPVLARRPKLSERAVKWCRRHRSLVMMAAAFMLLAFVGLAASTVIIATEQAKTKEALRSETNQRRAADESLRQARQAVDAFTELGEQELSSDPSLQALRRKFLETSLEYYQSFLRQRRDDSRVQAELTASSERVERLIKDLEVLEGFAALPLLRFPAVQDELGIPAAQGREIDAGLAELRNEHRNARDGHNDDKSQPPERRLADALRSQQKKISLLLTPQQLLRLKQVFWQQQGPFAFLDSDVAAALHLSADDRTNIRRIIDEESPGRHAERGAPPPVRGGPEPFHRGPPGPEAFGPGRPPPPLGGGPRDHERRGREPPPDDLAGPPGRPLPPPPRPRPPADGPGSDRFAREKFFGAVERVLDLLTEEQRQRWYDLIGEPFLVDLHLRPEDWSPW
jgi:serine/threonine protein kinase